MPKEFQFIYFYLVNMCSLDQATRIWLEDKLIPKIRNLLNKFNECTVEYKVSIPNNCFYISKLFFLELKFNNEEQKSQNKVSQVFFKATYYIVFKKNLKIRTILDFKIRFLNSR